MARAIPWGFKPSATPVAGGFGITPPSLHALNATVPASSTAVENNAFGKELGSEASVGQDGWSFQRAWSKVEKGGTNVVRVRVTVAIVLALLVLLLVTASLNVAHSARDKVWNWIVLATALSLMGLLAATFVWGGFPARKVSKESN